MKTNKKLLASAMALGLAGLTTVGSTYAWFTANGTATVGGVEMTAKSDIGGIYVANSNATAWNDTISLEGFTTGNELVPCTSVNGIDFYQKIGQVRVEGADNDTFKYKKLDSGKVGSTIYYIESVMHIAVATSVPAGGIEVKATVTPDNIDKKDILPVARVAVVTGARSVDAGTVAENTPVIYDFGGTRATNDVALNAYNKLYGMDIKNKASGTSETALDYVKGFTSNTQYDVTKHLGGEEETDKLVLANTLFTTFAPNDDLKLPAESGTYYYTTVKFRFWLEGNDKTCYNAVAQQKFRCELKLSLPGAGA